MKPALLLLALLTVLPRTASAQPEELCIGINPETKVWGLTEVNPTVREAYCSPGMAFLSNQPIPRRTSLPPPWKLSGSCCPLPSGSLTDEHEFRERNCSPGFVVTGGRDDMIRCTRINSDKYSLDTPAETLKADPSPDLIARTWYAIGVQSNLTSRLRIPPALRFGLGRLSRTVWLDTLCVGYPWGSPLTALGTKSCAGFRFTQLRPKDSQIVENVPPCRAVTDVYDEGAVCIR